MTEAAAPIGTGGRRVKRRTRRFGALNCTCATVLLAALFCALLGGVIAPDDPNAPSLADAYVGPSSAHPLGFDSQGRDVLSRLLAGAQSTLLGPLIVVVVSVTLGAVLALTVAWRGGWLDAVIGAVVDILFAFPAILLAVLAAAVFGAGLTAAAIALAVAYLPYVVRVLRSTAIAERNRPYIAALEVQGASAVSICLRHILPNVGGLVVAQATLMFGYSMVDLAAISYLGLGIQPPAANWGVMVSENQTGIIQGYPLPALTAGLLLVLVVIAANVLGERLFERT